MNKVLRASVALAVIAVVLAGCTSSPPGAPSSAESAAVSSESAPSDTPESSPEPGDSPDGDAHVGLTDTPGTLPGLVGALGDATVASFERRDGSWLAQGTVSNPSDERVDYRIYASAMGDGGTATRGVVQVDVVDVGAGDTVEWEASLPLEDEDLSLVLRVERASADE